MSILSLSGSIIQYQHTYSCLNFGIHHILIFIIALWLANFTPVGVCCLHIMSTLLPNCHNSDLQFRKTVRLLWWCEMTGAYSDLKWSHEMEYYYSWDHFKSMSTSDLVISIGTYSDDVRWRAYSRITWLKMVPWEIGWNSISRQLKSTHGSDLKHSHGCPMDSGDLNQSHG